MADDQLRRRILARRARFVAIVVAGAGAAGACGGSVQAPTDGGADAAAEAAPQPCLLVANDSGPQPCLGVALDAGSSDQ